jgi:hypothetical protein
MFFGVFPKDTVKFNFLVGTGFLFSMCSISFKCTYPVKSQESNMVILKLYISSPFLEQGYEF